MKLRQKNTAQRGIIIHSITGRTAMSSYLSSPNDSRNNCDSRYHETFFLLFLLFVDDINPRRAHNRRALQHIFYRGTHSGRYRAYCLLNRDLYAFAIFPSRDWTRQGWLEKSRCTAWLDDTHWNARGYTQRERHLSQRSPRGKFYSTCDVARYRGYYFPPRIFFVISANCTQRAAGLSEDLRRSSVSRNAQLPPFLSSKQVRTYSVFGRFRSEKLCRAIAREGNPRRRRCPIFFHDSSFLRLHAFSNRFLSHQFFSNNRYRSNR